MKTTIDCLYTYKKQKKLYKVFGFNEITKIVRIGNVNGTRIFYIHENTFLKNFNEATK